MFKILNKNILIDKYYRFFIKKHYSEYNTYNAKHRDYGSDMDFQYIYYQLKNFLNLYPNEFHTLCEIGSGDGFFLKYLSNKLDNIKLVGSDIPNHRIEKAKKKIPDIKFYSMDILEIQEKIQDDGVIFVAANIFGNITPTDLNIFFHKLNINRVAVIFCSATSMEMGNESKKRAGIGFEHNYLELINKYNFNVLDKKIIPREDNSERVKIKAAFLTR